MAAECVASEVVRTAMYLLKKWSFRVNETMSAQDAVNFTHDLRGIQNMLQDRLNHHGVDAARCQGDVMRVRNELCRLAAVNIEPDDTYAGISVQALDTASNRSASNNDDACRRRKKLEHEPDIPRSYPILRMPQWPQRARKALDGPLTRTGYRLGCRCPRAKRSRVDDA